MADVNQPAMLCLQYTIDPAAIPPTLIMMPTLSWCHLCLHWWHRKAVMTILGGISGDEVGMTMNFGFPWWRHQMETFSALLALCAGNSPVTGGIPSQRPVTWSFDVFFYLCLNIRLSKQSCGWWFDTPSRSLWRHCNECKFLMSVFIWISNVFKINFIRIHCVSYEGLMSVI